uniref:Uncharacterized protein n=1 Tax=Aegilops tauschii subsp. strangulata TaxID=200361 RepID=A0A453K3C6_AEGTS
MMFILRGLKFYFRPGPQNLRTGTACFIARWHRRRFWPPRATLLPKSVPIFVVRRATSPHESGCHHRLPPIVAGSIIPTTRYVHFGRGASVSSIAAIGACFVSRSRA